MPQPKYQLYLRGYTGGWDFDADYVDYVVGQNEGKRLDVLISSPGGSLRTALQIYAAFVRHGDVHVHYVGMNASAATIAGMGAKEITIADVGTFWLVHKSSIVLDVWKSMNSDDMTALIESLQKRVDEHETIDAQIARMYAKRCKRSPEELADLMTEEKWLTPEQALAWGFVDKVVSVDSPEGEKIPESVVCALREAGLPELPKECRPSLADKITEMVRSALDACGLRKAPSGLPEETSEEEPAPESDSNTENSNDMNPTETPAAEVQNEVQPEPQSVAMAQAPAAENAVENPEVAALRAELAKANARIRELEQAPGAATTNVIEQARAHAGEESPVDTLFENLSGARELMKSLGL